MQYFTDEALQQLPLLIRNFRRKSDCFIMEDIEESFSRLSTSPVQSPEEQTPSTVTFLFPQVSSLEPNIDPIFSKNENTILKCNRIRTSRSIT